VGLERLMTVFEYLRIHERYDIQEQIVSFVQYGSGFLLATNHNIYEIVDGKIAPIQVKE